MELYLNRVLKTKIESIAETIGREMGITCCAIPDSLRMHRGQTESKRLESLFTRQHSLAKGVCPGLCVARMEGASVFLDFGILTPDVKGHGEYLDREVEESQAEWKRLDEEYQGQFLYAPEMFIITAEKSKNNTVFSTAIELGMPDTKRKDLTGRAKSVSLQLQVPFEDLLFYWTLHKKPQPEQIKLLLNSRGTPIYIPSFYQEKAQSHLKSLSKRVNVAGLGDSYERQEGSNPLTLPTSGDTDGMKKFRKLLEKGKVRKMKQEERQERHEPQEISLQEKRLLSLQISKLEREQERELHFGYDFPSTENLHISTPLTQHKAWNREKPKEDKDLWHIQDTQNMRWNDPNQSRLQEINKGKSRNNQENNYEEEEASWYPHDTTPDYKPLNMRQFPEEGRENPPVRKKLADKLMWKEHGEFDTVPERHQRTHHNFPNTDNSVSSQETHVQTRKQDTRVFHNKNREKKLESQNQEERRALHRDGGGEERTVHPEFWNVKNELDRVNNQTREHGPSAGNQRSLDLRIQNLENQLEVQRQTNKESQYKALAQIDTLERDNKELHRQFATQSTTINQLESKVKHLLTAKEELEIKHDREIKQRNEDKVSDVQIINSLDVKVAVLIKQIKGLLKSEQGYEEALQDFKKNQSLLEDTIASQSNQMQLQKDEVKSLKNTITNLQIELDIARSQPEDHTAHTNSEEDKGEDTELAGTKQTKGETSRTENQEQTTAEEAHLDQSRAEASLDWDNFSHDTGSLYENTRVSEQQVTEEIEKMMSEERSTLSMELRKNIHPPDRYSP